MGLVTSVPVSGLSALLSSNPLSSRLTRYRNACGPCPEFRSANYVPVDRALELLQTLTAQCQFSFRDADLREDPSLGCPSSNSGAAPLGCPATWTRFLPEAG